MLPIIKTLLEVASKLFAPLSIFILGGRNAKLNGYKEQEKHREEVRDIHHDIEHDSDARDRVREQFK